MLFAVLLGILIGLASLLAMFALLLVPAVLVAWFLRGAPPPETVQLRPSGRELTLAGWIGRESAASRPTR